MCLNECLILTTQFHAYQLINKNIFVDKNQECIQVINRKFYVS